jgi:hypothetical protein
MVNSNNWGYQDASVLGWMNVGREEPAVIDALAALLIAVPAPADLPKCEPGYTHEVPGHPPCQIDWGSQPDVKMGPAAPPGWVPGPTPDSPWHRQ